MAENAGLDFALAQVRDRDLVIESLREQLEAERCTVTGEGIADDLRAMTRRAEAAEAKLAEGEQWQRIATERLGYVHDLRAKLAEVEKERDEANERASNADG